MSCMQAPSAYCVQAWQAPACAGVDKSLLYHVSSSPQSRGKRKSCHRCAHHWRAWACRRASHKSASTSASSGTASGTSGSPAPSLGMGMLQGKKLIASLLLSPTGPGAPDALDKCAMTHLPLEGFIATQMRALKREPAFATITCAPGHSYAIKIAESPFGPERPCWLSMKAC